MGQPRIGAACCCGSRATCRARTSALDATRRPSLTLEDRTGHVFASFGDVVGEPLRLTDMPPYLPQAVVAVEDRRFWHHSGIDLIGMARAALTDLVAGHVVQGGSTLTQQVAKNLFLSNARTLRRKVQELLLTVWLEQHFSKREILEIYLDRVYLGAGAWGMDAAARIYFGVSARHVTLWQAAVLAGLPRAPSRFNPRINPAAAAARAKEVLAAMVETGAITQAQAQAAAASIAFPPAPAIAAGWFADWAAAQAAPGTDRRTPTPRCTPRSIRGCSPSPSPGSRRCWMARAWPRASAQGAVVILDAATGAVRAMVGGRDYRSGSFNRAVEARRQPGSAFKPFTWLSALQTRADARLPGAGCADPCRPLEPGELRAPLRGRGHPDPGAGAVDQHGRGAAAVAGRRAARGGGDGGAAGDRRQAAGRRLAGAWAPARWDCWNCPRRMRRSSTTAIA